MVRFWDTVHGSSSIPFNSKTYSQRDQGADVKYTDAAQWKPALLTHYPLLVPLKLFLTNNLVGLSTQKYPMPLLQGFSGLYVDLVGFQMIPKKKERTMKIFEVKIINPGATLYIIF